MLEFKNVIFDECGCIRYWCSEMTEEEIEEVLENHPEWWMGVV